MIPGSAALGPGEPRRPELEETVRDHRGLEPHRPELEEVVQAHRGLEPCSPELEEAVQAHRGLEPRSPELEEAVQAHRGLVRRVQGEHAGKDVWTRGLASLRKDTKRNNHTHITTYTHPHKTWSVTLYQM